MALVTLDSFAERTRIIFAHNFETQILIRLFPTACSVVVASQNVCDFHLKCAVYTFVFLMFAKDTACVAGEKLTTKNTHRRGKQYKTFSVLYYKQNKCKHASQTPQTMKNVFMIYLKSFFPTFLHNLFHTFLSAVSRRVS